MNNTDFTTDNLRAIKYALGLAGEIIDEKIETEEVPEYRLIDCIGESNAIVCYGTYDEVQYTAERYRTRYHKKGYRTMYRQEKIRMTKEEKYEKDVKKC